MQLYALHKILLVNPQTCPFFLVFPRAGYRAVRGVLAGQQDFPTALAMATFLGNIAALYLVVST